MEYDAGAGASPYHGELVLALDPQRFLGDRAQEHLARAEAFLNAFDGTGARLPSQRRHQARERSLAEGVRIPAALHADLVALLEYPRPAPPPASRAASASPWSARQQPGA